jgi:hypothetical protein
MVRITQYVPKYGYISVKHGHGVGDIASSLFSSGKELLTPLLFSKASQAALTEGAKPLHDPQEPKLETN